MTNSNNPILIIPTNSQLIPHLIIVIIYYCLSKNIILYANNLWTNNFIINIIIKDNLSIVLVGNIDFNKIHYLPTNIVVFVGINNLKI